jgi:hypothetical protein
MSDGHLTCPLLSRRPSSMPSPDQASPPFSTPTASASAYIQQHSGQAHNLSIPVDLIAVNQGIAPQLTSGIPTPPLDVSNQLGVMQSDAAPQHPQANSKEQKPQDVDQKPALLRAKSARKEQQRSRRNSHDADVSRSTSREASVSRRASAANANGNSAGSAPTSTSRAKKQTGATASVASTSASGAATPSLLSHAHLVGASTNLVTKDAVIAAHSITSITSASSSATRVQLAQAGLELLVLGIPIAGAKSRVETQIKISLVLVRTKIGVVVDPVPRRGADLPGQRFITLDGGLEQAAGNDYERVGAWTHLRLPGILALKKKGKKQAKPGECIASCQPRSPD